MTFVQSELARRLAFYHVCFGALLIGLSIILGAFDRSQNILARGFILGGLLLVGFVGSLLLVRLSVVNPLRRIDTGLRRYLRGRRDQRLRIDAWGELSDVSDTMDEILRLLNQESEDLQSELRDIGVRSGLLTTVLESMVDGIMVTDSRLHVLFANPVSARLLDFQVERAAGRPLVEVGRNSRITNLVSEVMENGQTRQTETEIPRTRKTVKAIVTPLPEGFADGCVLMLHDVTELRRLERMRQEFVGNVSHELKTPLTSIQAYAETLLDGDVDDAECRRRFLRQILDQADRQHSQIRDLLTLSRIESGAAALELQPVWIKEAIVRCLESQREVAIKSGVKLILDPESPDCQSLLDTREFQTILENLVSNAIKYSDPDGEVRLWLELHEAEVLLHVEDDGEGIAADHLSRVFERFYRTDRARSRDKGGTGLGLSIVKHLVQAMNGSVHAESTVGQGSRFTVRLPVLIESIGDS